MYLKSFEENFPWKTLDQLVFFFGETGMIIKKEFAGYLLEFRLPVAISKRMLRSPGNGGVGSMAIR